MKNKNVLYYGVILILFILAIFLVSISNFLFKDNSLDNNDNDKNKNEFNIVGTWYKYSGMALYEYKFNDDGTYLEIIYEYDDNGRETEGTYTFENNKLILYKEVKYFNRGNPYTEKVGTEYNLVDFNDDSFLVYYKGYDLHYKFYKDKDSVMPYDEECPNPDKDGFCIKNNELIAYIGKAKEIIIPSNVTSIGPNAFAGDYDRAINLRKLTIPGSVKKVGSSAFMFSSVDEVYLEEGVRELGGAVFGDTCLTVLDLPKSINKIGGSILESEEICSRPLKIYLYKDSYADDYFKVYEPYYNDYEIIYK